MLLSSIFQLLFIFEITQLVTGFTYTSYQTKIECNSKSPILTPRSLNELVSIVNGAIRSGTRVKVIGSRHSVSDVICTDGIPIHLRYFNNVTVNRNEGIATVGAGLQIMDALDALNQYGVTINHLPSFGGITVGGTVALGAHGSSLIHPNTPSEYLTGVTFIDGNGRLRSIWEGDEDFDAFRVNFGLLGIVTEATFRVSPQYKMRMRNYREPDTLLVNNPNEIIRMARHHDWFQMWWFPTSNGIILSEGDNVPVDTPGNAQTNLVSNASPAIAAVTKVGLEAIQVANNSLAMNAIQRLTEQSLYQPGVQREQVFTDNGRFANPATGYGYRMMTSRCTQCGWDGLIVDDTGILAEEPAVGIKLSHFPAVISDMNKLFHRFPTAFPLFGILIRFSRASRGEMSMSKGQDTVHIDWTFPMRLNPYTSSPYQLSVMQSLMQLLVFKYNGRPHWGKNGLAYFSNSLISNRYPSLPRFQSALRRYDPNGLYSNKFGNRILGIGQDTFEIPDRVEHCALQDYCICRKNSDCAALQKCGSLIGYPVCVSDSPLQKIGEIVDGIL